MRPAARLALSGLVLATLVACGAPAPAPQDKEEAKALGRDTDETVFDDMIQTQDRARAVEDVTMDAKRNLDETIDAQTGDASDESGDN